MDSKKAQALIVSLWILVILALLAIGIGFRVSNALKIVRYQKYKLRAYYLAKAAINVAIKELEKDTNGYDSLLEPWVDNETLFKNINFDNNEDASAYVGYYAQIGGLKGLIFGLVDEERKININSAYRELLITLFEKYNISSAEELADNILIWRGDIPDDDNTYDAVGYPAKKSGFSNIEELSLVKGINSGDYLKVRNSITVYGEGFLNINTASLDILQILSCAIAKRLSIDEGFGLNVAGRIITLRNEKGFFRNREDIDIEFISEEEDNIYNQLLDEITFKSDNFFIQTTGNVNKIKSSISNVYSRLTKKILYWHES